MSPIIIDESSVKPFCFYLDGSLHKGMSYRKRLFWLFETFNPRDCEQIRETCLDLRRQRLTCIITKSDRYYRIWTDLRALPLQLAPSTPTTTFPAFPIPQTAVLNGSMKLEV